MMDAIHSVSAAVLAGGKSSRMGCDKANLMYRSVPLAKFQIQKLANLGMDDLMISGYADSLEGVRNIADIYKERGPLGGIHAVLTNAVNPGCLVLPIDTPRVPEHLLIRLVNIHRHGDTPITLISNRGKLEPLIGVYSRTLIPMIEEMLKNRSASVKALLEYVKVSLCLCDVEPSVFINCNTPDEYVDLLSEMDVNPKG